MKTLMPIGIVVAAILIAWGIWLFVFSGKTTPVAGPTGNTETSMPSIPTEPPTGIPPSLQQPQPTAQQQSKPVVVQQVPSPQDPTVAHAFMAQDNNGGLTTLGGTVIATPYALQIWGDEYMGGEALLKYATSTGWILVSAGGGEWTVDDLVAVGVPQTYAEQLVAGLGEK